MQEFNLSGKEFIALCDLLKTTGLTASGGHAKLVISEGEVSVDGVVDLKKRSKIRPGQIISYEGQEIKVL